MSLPSITRSARVVVPCAALASLAALAPAASARPTQIDLAPSLERTGVHAQAIAPARAKSGGVALPTATVAISGDRATVGHRGGVRLHAGGRAVALRAVRVRVGSRSALAARVGGARRTVFTIAAPPQRRTVGETGVSLDHASLRLTRTGAAFLSRRLQVAVRPGRAGTIDLKADASAPAGPPRGGMTGPPTPGGATLSARPATAVTITGGLVRWSPRASWLGYLQQGEGATAEGAATFDGTTYRLPVTGGWYDPASGRGVVTTTGTTRFRQSSHGVDLSFSDWAYDLAATRPKTVATVGSTGKRVPIQLIKDVARPLEIPGAARWGDLPVTLATEAVSLFRAYPYDSDQGRVTIEVAIG